MALTRISTDRNIVGDDDLVEMKKQLPAIQQRIDNVSRKYNELLKLVPDQVGDRKTLLDNIITLQYLRNLLTTNNTLKQKFIPAR